MTTSTQQSTDRTQTPSAGRMLRRRPRGSDRLLGGVAGGIADYLGIDAIVVRVLLVLLTLVSGAGIAVYLACWLLVPEQGSDRSTVDSLLHS